MTSFAVISLYTAFGMVTLMIVMSPTRGLCVFQMSAFNWFLLVSSALIGIALGHVFYYAAIARLGVAIASGVIQLAPFLTAAGAMVLFGEKLTAGQWESGFIVLAGALLLLKAEQHRRSGMAQTRLAAPIELEDAGDPTAISEPPSEDPLTAPAKPSRTASKG
jgi:drug/metabolite transporter (DMT)-like permease